MKILLKKKNDPSDKDPLIVQYVDGPEGKQFKKTVAIKIGETLDLPDDVAFDVMGRYRGLFTLAEGESVQMSERAAATIAKGKPQYADKALAPQG